jgi:hypothetical protein
LKSLQGQSLAVARFVVEIKIRRVLLTNYLIKFPLFKKMASAGRGRFSVAEMRPNAASRL